MNDDPSLTLFYSVRDGFFVVSGPCAFPLPPSASWRGHGTAAAAGSQRLSRLLPRPDNQYRHSGGVSIGEGGTITMKRTQYGFLPGRRWRP